MAGTSKHYEDILSWVHKVLDSITNASQMPAAENLYNQWLKCYYMQYAMAKSKDMAGIRDKMIKLRKELLNA